MFRQTCAAFGTVFAPEGSTGFEGQGLLQSGDGSFADRWLLRLKQTQMQPLTPSRPLQSRMVRAVSAMPDGNSFG